MDRQAACVSPLQTGVPARQQHGQGLGVLGLEVVGVDLAGEQELVDVDVPDPKSPVYR